MRWLLLGLVLGLLLLYPSLVGILAAVVAAILSKPLVVAFGLGLAVRLPRLRRWAR
ncbi:hypothetical protein OG252_33295 [Streptomyces sp. NBC_01352]|uniref:hypothetical protein n=1 Tax=Streptomyces sp. NBC_01352 TaxID=2903834 RepID=UPI002E3327EC|nr:hypothetical protein [Streptomyces sp. NBC_01352]